MPGIDICISSILSKHFNGNWKISERFCIQHIYLLTKWENILVHYCVKKSTEVPASLADNNLYIRPIFSSDKFLINASNAPLLLHKISSCCVFERFMKEMQKKLCYERAQYQFTYQWFQYLAVYWIYCGAFGSDVLLLSEDQPSEDTDFIKYFKCTFFSKNTHEKLISKFIWNHISKHFLETGA